MSPLRLALMVQRRGQLPFNPINLEPFIVVTATRGQFDDFMAYFDFDRRQCVGVMTEFDVDNMPSRWHGYADKIVYLLPGTYLPAEVRAHWLAHNCWIFKIESYGITDGAPNKL